MVIHTAIPKLYLTLIQLGAGLDVCPATGNKIGLMHDAFDMGVIVKYVQVITSADNI